MKIAILQYDVKWQDAKANINYIDKQLKHVNADLILLPEMFNSGFSMHPKEMAEKMDGETVTWLKETSKKMDTPILATVAIEDEGGFYNRALWVHETVKFAYDKRHLFTMAGEHEVYNAGTEKLMVEYKGFKFCINICYDLRFPVWTRNAEDFDVLVYLANWPEARVSAWDTLLKARAIENACYSIGVNRVGVDGNEVAYTGRSGVYDFKGNNICFLNEEPILEYAELDKPLLDDYKKKFPVLDDADEFNLKV